MGIPSFEFIQELQGEMVAIRNNNRNRELPDYDSTIEEIETVLKNFRKLDKAINIGANIAKTSIVSALQKGINVAAGASNMGVSVSASLPSAASVVSAASMASMLTPTVGTVLAPWVAAATIASSTDTLFSIYDLKDGTNGCRVFNNCACPAELRNLGLNCNACLQYIIDKIEGRAAKTAVGVASLGVSSAFTTGWSIMKWLQSDTRPKEAHSRGLVLGAQAGCIKAICAIFVLSSSTFFGDDLHKHMRALAILVTENGWETLKSLI